MGAYVSGLRSVFVDLNTDDVTRIPLKTRASRLRELYLPKTALGVDFLVSMPKLKTHHWAGATLALKNLFGLVPGSLYGWPKNYLHTLGIPQSVAELGRIFSRTFAKIVSIPGIPRTPMRSPSRSPNNSRAALA